MKPRALSRRIVASIRSTGSLSPCPSHRPERMIVSIPAAAAISGMASLHAAHHGWLRTMKSKIGGQPASISIATAKGSRSLSVRQAGP